MKDSSKVMYTIGRVFTIIGIVGLAIMIAVSIFAITSSADLYAEFMKDGYSHFSSAAQVKQFGVMATVVCSIFLVIECLVLSFAKKAQKSLKDGKNSTTPHTIMLVLGIFGQNLFYFLGGIFGLVAANKE